MSFPIGPSIDDTFIQNGVTYKWDGTAWSRVTLTPEAENISYDGTTSGLVATKVQDAIDEVVSTTYTKTESDTLKSISKVASSVLLSGNVAIADTAVTKSNANVTYTGNGTSQNIVTGIGSVDFTVANNGSGYYHDRVAGDCIVKNDAGTIVEEGSCVVNTSKNIFKTRNGIGSNNVMDSVRGGYGIVYTDGTNSETNIGGTKIITPSNTGISILGNFDINGNGVTYILHQTLYTHIQWGLTSQGKRYISAYNPVTREVMTMYQGSGVAGHQIPNPLGIKLDYLEAKNLDNVSNWSVNTGNNRIYLNLTNSEQTGSNEYDLGIEYINIGTSTNVNTSNNTYISYGFANSETKVITQYIGTGVAGNFIPTNDVNGVAKKPRRIIIKRTDSADNWLVYDTERNEDYFIILNSSNSEDTSQNFFDITPNGFNFNGSGLNISGGQYIAIVEFDTTSSNDDTYFDLPTDDTNLNVTTGILPYSNGRNSNGGYNVTSKAYTGSIDFTTCPDGIHYVAMDDNNVPKFYEKVAVGLYDKTSADDNRLVFDTDSGKWYTTTGGELVRGGTFESQAEVGEWTGRIDGTGTLANVNNSLYLSGSSVYYYAEQVVSNLEIGEEYWFEANAITGTAATLYMANDSVDGYAVGPFFRDSNNMMYGAFIAEATTITIRLVMAEIGTAYFDNISVYKKEATLGTPLPNPVSFIDEKPYQVASGTPMARLEDYPSIPKNVMESTHIAGKLEVKDSIVFGDKPIFKGYAGGTHITAPGVIFDWTVEEDTHNAYSNGLWTCPKDGWYRFNPRVWNAHNTTTTATVSSSMYVNGLEEARLYSTGTNYQKYIGIEPTILKNLKRGDTMYIESFSASATDYIYFTGGKAYTNVVIEYIGETK